MMGTNSKETYWPEVCGPAGRSMGNWSMGATLKRVILSARNTAISLQNYGTLLHARSMGISWLNYGTFGCMPEVLGSAGRTIVQGWQDYMGSLLTDWDKSIWRLLLAIQSVCFHFSIQYYAIPPPCTSMLKYKIQVLIFHAAWVPVFRDLGSLISSTCHETPNSSWAY